MKDRTGSSKAASQTWPQAQLGGQRPGLSSAWLPLGASTCTPHLFPAGGVPTHPGHIPTSHNTHQQDHFPKVGGSQQHVQIMGDLNREVGVEAGSLGSPSQDPSGPSHKQALAYLVPHQRQLQGPRLEVTLQGRVEEVL